jgi:hypothetical protein
MEILEDAVKISSFELNANSLLTLALSEGEGNTNSPG